MKKLTPILRKDRQPLWEMLPLAQPLRVNIDPCDLCNFKCDFCFQSKTHGFRGSVMTDDLFESVLVQLKEFNEPINVIQLFCLGEPLINKSVPNYIRRIHEENVAKEVKITTNGSLLTHSLIDDVMSAGLDEFVISLNGLDDDDFARITKTKVSFCELLENIKYLYGSKRDCHVHVKIIGDYFSDEKKQFFMETISPYTDTLNIDGATNHWSGLTEQFRHQQYAFGDGTICDYPLCALCFYELAVHSDGTVSPCAADWQKDKQNLGNIMEHSLKEIWESDLRRKMIISFLKGEENPYVACRRCEYPGSGVSVDLAPYREELLKRYV